MESPTVLCTVALPDPFMEQIREDCTCIVMDHPPTYAELCAAVAKYKPVVLCPQLVDSVDKEVLKAGAPNLRAVCIYAVGYNNVDLQAAKAFRVAICNTPDVLTDTTADLALTLILSVARRVVEGDEIMRRDAFRGWAPTYLLGKDIGGQTLGIVGFGRIGQAVARRASSFGMNIIYVPHTAGQTLPEDLQGNVTECDMDMLFATADFVSLHVPLTPETRHLVDADRLATMKTSAVLINTARGPIVDEEALADALENKRLWGAGLDVFEQEPLINTRLKATGHTVFLPHVGSATPNTRRAMAERVASNVRAVLAGAHPPFAVYDPEF